MTNKRIAQFMEPMDLKSMAIFYAGKAPKKSNDQHYPFSVNRNFYYLTGIDQAHVYLVIIKGELSQKSYLFIEKTDPIKALWDGAGLTFEKAKEIASVDEVKDIEDFDGFFGSILNANRTNTFGIVDKVYFDLEQAGINDQPDHVRTLCAKLLAQYPFLVVLNAHLILARMRTRKDLAEIQAIEEALKVTKKAFHGIMKKAKTLNFEHEIEAEYQYVLNKKKMAPSFNTIVASGLNATILHYVDNNAPLIEDGLILVDAGVEYQHYCSDITRTFPKNGIFTERQKEIYNLVLKANIETIDWVRPGITLKEFNEFGRNLLIKGAKNIGLIKEDDEINQYYYHSLGHNLGLDVHDVADYSKPFEVGQVLTVEPGLYIKEEGIGIRIEDDIVITENGCINLSKDIIKSVEEIEKYMG